jgi:DNA-directed RNA polymerase specialized sigma24 family protein
MEATKHRTTDRRTDATGIPRPAPGVPARGVSIPLVSLSTLLNEQQIAVLTLRYRCGFTQAEAAEELGLTQRQVSRIERKSLDIAASQKNLVLDV